ncbi:MAG: alpha/beta hydrolase-fold protein [Pseudomonadota bacterium]
MFLAWKELQKNQNLAKAVETESLNRLNELASGIIKYKDINFQRDLAEPFTVLRIGNARLLEFESKNQNRQVIFLVPSLINRYYILDLTKKLSFARYLSDQGFKVFIVDWDSPSKFEKNFNSALYVTEILIPMLEWVRNVRKEKITLAGYCMGGLLALALATIRPELLDKIAFFSTPWNFFAKSFPRIEISEKDISSLKTYISSQESISPDFIHNLFHYANPCAFHNKLRELASIDVSDPKNQDFLAIEHWVNDGVPMTANVALDCLVKWTQYNDTANLKWRVGGQNIDPSKLKMPTFLVAPVNDNIVPYECAIPLAGLIKNCDIISPNSGHISMMVGKRRKSELWEPFCKWLMN